MSAREPLTDGELDDIINSKDLSPRLVVALDLRDARVKIKSLEKQIETFEEIGFESGKRSMKFGAEIKRLESLLSTQQAEVERGRGFLKEAAKAYCSLNCESVKKTGEEWKHHPKCVEFNNV